MLFRIGVHFGDVMVDGDDLPGDATNIAARPAPLIRTLHFPMRIWPGGTGTASRPDTLPTLPVNPRILAGQEDQLEALIYPGFSRDQAVSCTLPCNPYNRPDPATGSRIPIAPEPPACPNAKTSTAS